MSKQDTIYATGLFAKRGEGAPDYVICTTTYKVDEFIEFLKQHKDSEGYTRVDILLAKDGKKMYGKLNTFKSKKQMPNNAIPVKRAEDDQDEDVPF
jgi:hypothetical protein